VRTSPYWLTPITSFVARGISRLLRYPIGPPAPPAQLAAVEQSYATPLHRGQHGEDLTAPLAWQHDRIDELRRELVL
jgi:hypothetical protein